MKNIKNTDKEYIANTYARFDLQIASGKGALLVDESGKEYIDLGSGIAVNTFGACDTQWIEAVTQQLSTLQHISNLYYTEPQAKLAELLCKKTGMKKVFFCNSGAEANECAIKCARKYSSDKYGDQRNVIITLQNSFHGRTITTLSATGQETFHHDFGPFTEGFRYVEANNIEALDHAIDSNVCGIMFELIQGEGGVCPLTKDYVDHIFQIAKEKDILTIIDEVQTGNGRTGELYCFMNYSVQPDIFSTAKGLAGGLPFGSTLMNEKVKSTMTGGSHGSTFGGNPVCASGALNIVQRIDKNLLADVKAKSDFITSQLSSCKNVESISGIGLMLGIKTTKSPKDVVTECIEKGVLVLTAKDKIRLLPPLNIPMEQLEKAINILKEVIEK